MDTAESFKILNRFFVDMIRPNLLKIIIAIAVMIVSSACTAGMAYLIKPLLNNVVVPKSVLPVNVFLPRIIEFLLLLIHISLSPVESE
jgi:hypothetical protein